MTSIKHKTLLTFCATAATIILALGLLISSRLGASIKTQSRILSSELTAMSHETLVGYQGVLKSTVNRIMEDVDEVSVQISRNTFLLERIEDKAGIQMTAFLNDYRNQTDKIDFAALFDLNGNYLASSPSDIYDNVDKGWLEEFYRSSELWRQVGKVLKILETELESDGHALHTVVKLDVDFVKAFQLTEQKLSQDGFLSMQSAKVIKDRIKEPLAIVVTGKILNNYQKPFKEFYETTGFAGAVYLGTSAIAQMGFFGQSKEISSPRNLKISRENLSRIYEADKPIDLSLTLAGKRYRTTSSAITESGGRKIGAVLVGMPERKITEINRRISIYSNEEKRRLQLWILAFGIGSLGILILVSIAIATQVSRPVLRVVNFADAIAGGDLSQRLGMSRKDEIGSMATALDNSCKNLSEMIAQIKSNADMLASASEEMSSVSTQMASSADEMSTQAETVAGTTEQMSANINSMASAAEEMSVNAQNISSTAEEMSQNVDAVAAAIEEMSASIHDVARSAQAGSDIAGQAADMSTSATETMTALGAAAKEIDKVTGLIKRIAEQTNLLALNATIEAASAGDAGKGFAVVANEIKELANQSAQAAEDIAQRIEGVQVNTKQATAVIGDIAEVINKVNESSQLISKSVEQQTITANEISGNVQQASRGVNNIASSMAEIARGANDVSKSAAEAAKGVTEVSANIQGVNQAANDSNAGAQQVSASAGELAKMAVQIQTMVDRFKIGEQ